MANLAKSAVWYARHGWYVMPLHSPIFADGACVGCSCEEWKRQNVATDYVCRTPGKHPRHNDWETVASVDVEQVGRWWQAWPDANIGIAAGKSGLVVLDADLYKDGGGRWSHDWGETVTSQTGGGGEHLIYKHPEIDTKLGNSKQGLPAYIDVRGWGGMFVAPPSLHPSGNRYEWESGYGVHEIEPLPLPDEIAEPLKMAAQNLTAVTESFGAVDVTLEDYAHKLPAIVFALLRNDRSKIDFWLIRSLVRAGMSQDEIGALWQNYDPTGKYSDKNGQGDKYLAHTIARAREHLGSVELPKRSEL